MKAIALCLLLPACAVFDRSTQVNVAPSAHEDVEKIANAVDALNEVLGEEVYTLRMIDHEHRVDGEIVVRLRDDVLAEKGAGGDCEKTKKGVIVRIAHVSTEVAIAHELGHAAGLHHHPDKRNLMYEAAGHWGLTDAQKDDMIGASW